jgi:hypothetical protein
MSTYATITTLTKNAPIFAVAQAMARTLDGSVGTKRDEHKARNLASQIRRITKAYTGEIPAEVQTAIDEQVSAHGIKPVFDALLKFARAHEPKAGAYRRAFRRFANQLANLHQFVL